MKKVEMVNSIMLGLRKYEELHKTDQQRRRLREAAGATDRMNLECVVRRMDKVTLGEFALALTKLLKEMATPHVQFKGHYSKVITYDMWEEDGCLMVRTSIHGHESVVNATKLGIKRMGGKILAEVWGAAK